MKTSRNATLDTIELIANLIASVSHLQELISSTDDIDEQKRYEDMLLELIDIRRAIMSNLPMENKNLRCSLKHAIAQWGYALEIYYAERTILWKEISEALSKYMYKILSEFMGTEIVDCWRCLNDLITKENEDV